MLWYIEAGFQPVLNSTLLDSIRCLFSKLSMFIKSDISIMQKYVFYKNINKNWIVAISLINLIKCCAQPAFLLKSVACAQQFGVTQLWRRFATEMRAIENWENEAWFSRYWNIASYQCWLRKTVSMCFTLSHNIRALGTSRNASGVTPGAFAM